MAVIAVEVLAGEVQRRLASMQKAAQDTRPAFQAIGRVITTRIKMGFRISRSPAGAPWLPLRSRIGQPLRDTGRLQRSIGYRAQANETVIGTNLKYAPIHQFGGTIRPRNKPFLVFKTRDGYVRARKVTIPARPFMPLDAAGNLLLPPEWGKSALREMARALGVTA